MANDPEDSVITEKMKEILKRPENDAICGKGKGGLFTDDFYTALLLSFDKSVRQHVQRRIFDLQQQADFDLITRNRDGDPAVCLVSTATRSLGVGSRATRNAAAVASPTKDHSREAMSKAIRTNRAASKAEIVNAIHGKLNKEISKAHIESVLTELGNMMTEHLVPLPNGPGKFTIPGAFAFEVRSEDKAIPTVVNGRALKRRNDSIG